MIYIGKFKVHGLKDAVSGYIGCPAGFYREMWVHREDKDLYLYLSDYLDGHSWMVPKDKADIRLNGILKDVIDNESMMYGRFSLTNAVKLTLAVLYDVEPCPDYLQWIKNWMTEEGWKE